MALDSALICNTLAPDDEICKIIVHCGGVVSTLEDGNLRYRAPGLWGTIMPVSTLSRELTSETFGFIPTKEFLFRLDKFEEFENGLRNMVQFCTTMIRELLEDCVLLIEDVPILLRRNRTLTLQLSGDDQNRKRLLESLAEGIGDSYTIGNLPRW